MSSTCGPKQICSVSTMVFNWMLEDVLVVGVGVSRLGGARWRDTDVHDLLGRLHVALGEHTAAPETMLEVVRSVAERKAGFAYARARRIRSGPFRHIVRQGQSGPLRHIEKRRTEIDRTPRAGLPSTTLVAQPVFKPQWRMRCNDSRAVPWYEQRRHATADGPSERRWSKSTRSQQPTLIPTPRGDPSPTTSTFAPNPVQTRALRSHLARLSGGRTSRPLSQPLCSSTLGISGGPTSLAASRRPEEPEIWPESTFCRMTLADTQASSTDPELAAAPELALRRLSSGGGL